MKKILFVVLMCIVSVAFVVPTAFAAKTKLVPEGTYVSAVKNGTTATITIEGDLNIANVESYTYEKVVDLGPVKTFSINLREGRRFGIKFKVDGKIYYALLTADMHNVEFIDADSIGIDNRDPRGACFTVL